MTTKAELIDAIKQNNLSILSTNIKLSKLYFCYNYAVTYGHTSVVKLLLTNDNIDPSIDNNNAIKIASKKGYTDIVKYLLTTNINPSVLNNYPIRTSAENNHIDVLKILLSDSRTDATDSYNEAFITSIRLANTDIIKLLLSHLTEKDKLSDLLLHEGLLVATENGHTDIVNFLYELYPSDAGQYLRLNEILCMAVQYSRIEIIKLLLKDYRSDPTFNKSIMLNITKNKQVLYLLNNSIKKNSILKGNLSSTNTANKIIKGGFVDTDIIDVKFSLEGTRRKVIMEFYL